MKVRFFLFLAILIGFFSCKKDQKTATNLNGAWNSIGYGKQFIVTDSIVTIYDICKSGCSFNSQLPKELFENKYYISRLTNDSLTIRYGFTDYNFIHPNSETGICKEPEKSNDPITNFDALWETFNEYYVSFKLREIDWMQSRGRYRSRLNSKSNDLELYKVLSEMILELNDEHVSMPIPEALKDEIDKDNNHPRDLRESVITTFNAKYVDSLKTYNKGIVYWGIINNTIGYIQINAFEDLANYSIDQELSVNEFWEKYWEKAEESKNYRKDILNGIKGLMPQIFQDIKNTKSCIIDVRFNGGGFDETGLEVLSYFTNKKTVAYTKKARLGNGFTKSQTIYVEPNGQMYHGNVYILSSFQTASASETFLLASRNLPKVKTIGSNTMGIYSDILNKRLPNGWLYGLSTEIYESANGINYERYGIPPDFALNYKKNAKEFYTNLVLELNDEDRAIKKVIALNAE